MPLVDGFDNTSILSIGHLSIVAGAYDSLQIAAVIDSAIPKTRQHHLSHSQVVKAMILNGLGFIAVSMASLKPSSSPVPR